MGKDRKKENKNWLYDEIRKPTPKPGFAMNGKNKYFEDVDDQLDEIEELVDWKTIQKLKRR